MPEPRTPPPADHAGTARPGRRRALAAVPLLLLAAALPAAAPAQRSPSLAGQLLVAADGMPDARFARAVIYVVKHDQSGAQGFVVNRPLREIALAALMEQMGLPSAGVSGQVRMHAGGPVESLGIFALHTGEWSAPGTQAVTGGFAVTAHPEILRALAEARGPRRVIFLLGYAGWAPGQLEAEVKGGYWLKAAPDEALVFDADHDTKWERATKRQRIDL